jgi:hypothetical protein
MAVVVLAMVLAGAVTVVMVGVVNEIVDYASSGGDK